ncbi:MAG: hypothetical protein ThorAB25_03460 [Candidatus Thorarchaeota archaeon AB_25]|nr:MAG: hypothetical protein ThorAB25_03460 [Candidatus Thorarchaeota archaeon AB_25]
MKPTVIVVDNDSLTDAFDHIEGMSDLNSLERKVIVKVGIYNPETGICTTVKTLQSIVDSFDKSLEIRVTESDSGAGPGLKRLEIWNDCYNERVVPFNLSDDKDTKDVDIAGESVPFPKIFSQPNTFISTHVPRRYEDAGLEDLMNLGFVIKNLLGMIPDTRKHRFHKHLTTTLLDIYEAIGGIDLAVLDATNCYLGFGKKRITVTPNLLIVGTDAFAVEAVGGHLVGFEPTEMPVLQEAKKRGLGEIDLDMIHIIGDLESQREMISKAFKRLGH